MAVRYITFEVMLKDSVSEMIQLIEANLEMWGAPLSWCVIDADPHRQTMNVVGVFQE